MNTTYRWSLLVMFVMCVQGTYLYGMNSASRAASSALNKQLLNWFRSTRTQKDEAFLKVRYGTGRKVYKQTHIEKQ
jgi:hypothetical protein